MQKGIEEMNQAEIEFKKIYPNAEIGLGSSKYHTWFIVIRPSEKATFWKDRPSYGRGDTERLAWENAVENHKKGKND